MRNSFALRLPVLGLFVVLLLASNHAPPLAAQTGSQTDPSRILINYAQVDEEEGQQLSIYFNLVDDFGRTTNVPTISASQLLLNSQVFNGAVRIPDDPLNIALVLDASGSMTPSAERMREAAMTAVNTTPQGTRFSVIQFNEQIITRTGFTDDRAAVVQSIETMTDDQFEGGTCLYDAALEALEALQVAGVSGRRAVILFTDGRDELIAGGELDRCSTNADFNRLVQTARNPQLRIPIYTIGLIGTQAINQQELQALADNTGGVSVSGADTELTSLFLEIVQSFAGQRVANFNVCLPAGEFNGLMNVSLGESDGELIAPVSGLTFTTACAEPTPTPTSVPLALSITSFRFDPATNEIVFMIQRTGTGNVSFLRVEVIDQATGVLVPGDYGMITLPGDAAGEVRVPLDRVVAPEWLVRVSAYDSSGLQIAQSEPAEVIPERTATPTPPPTTTPTPEPSPTLVATAVPSTVQIGSIQYLTGADGGEFVINLRLDNVSAETVSDYTVRVENAAQIQVASETRLTLPTNRVTFAARDSESEALAPGQYLITVELTTRGGGVISANREVVVPPPPPTPTPPPEPSATERLIRNINANPVVAIGLILLGLGILFLILLAISRGRAQRQSFRKRVFPQSYSASREPGVLSAAPSAGRTAVTNSAASAPPRIDGSGVFMPALVPPSEGLPPGVTARITIIQSPDPDMQSGRAVEVTAREFSVGRTLRNNDLVINAEGVSKNHFVLRWLNNQFFIQDLNSTNHTLLANQKLEPMKNEPLEAGKEHTILAGKKTRLQFVYYVPPEARALLETQTELEVAPPTPRLEIPPASEVPFAAASPSGTANGHEDMPTYVGDDELPPHVEAVLILIGAEGVEQSHPVTAVLTTFGRKSANTYSFDNVEISREHARLDWENGAFVLKDLGSGNGTFVNDERITRSGKSLLPGLVYQLRFGKAATGVYARFSYTLPRPPLVSDEDEPTQV